MRRFGLWIIAFVALFVFVIKVMMHYSILTGTALSVSGIIIAFLPLLFALAITMIISMKSIFGNIVLFVVSLIVAYAIIVPIYLSGI